MAEVDKVKVSYQVIDKPFDPSKDYFGELTDKEKHSGEYPLLKGLQRLAHTNRGGIKGVHTAIIATPSADNKLAAVEFQVHFNDGTVFSGAADATDKAHKAPYNLHLVAVAEAKAESRALRRAFNISKVAFEEIGSASEVVGDADNTPITDIQVQGIASIAKRKNLTKKDVLELVGRGELNDIKELTGAEGREAMKLVNKAKAKAGESDE